MSYDAVIARSPFIIYQPGGTATGLVVTSWTAVQKFIAARDSAVTVFIDDSVTSPAPVPAGTTDCQGRVTFAAYRPNLGTRPSLALADGAVLINPLAFTSLLYVICQGASQPNFQFTNGVVLFVQSATIDNQGSQPCVSLAGGAIFGAFFFNGGSFKPTSAEFIAMPTAGAEGVMFMLTNSGVQGDNVFTGVAGTAAVFTFDADLNSGTVPTNPGFSGTFTAQMLDQANLVGYSPNNPSVWPVVPTQVAQALDELANAMTPQDFLFTSTDSDVFATLRSQGYTNVQANIRGVGGGGGGGGGEGGATAGAGVGGGGGGAAQEGSISVPIDLAHVFDVIVGAGGTPGAAGAPGGGDGGPGGVGGYSYLFDTTTNTVIASFTPASGGEGGGSAAGAGGANFPLAGLTNIFSPATNPYPGGGGSGGFGGDNGSSGSLGLASFEFPGGGASSFLPGAGGTTNGSAGGGGGGGAGPFGNGGVGGNGATPVGGSGTAGDANSGAGAGGGGGGTTVADPGGLGGTGGTGFLAVTISL
jgi:hypothetical protein